MRQGRGGGAGKRGRGGEEAAHPHTFPHSSPTLVKAEATQAEASLLRQAAEEAAQRSAGEAAAARQTAAQLDGALKAKERDAERGAKVRRGCVTPKFVPAPPSEACGPTRSSSPLIMTQLLRSFRQRGIALNQPTN